VYRSTAPYDELVAEVEHTDANTVTVRTTVVPTPGQFTVVCSGPGAAGATSGDLTYVHNQVATASTWNVTHNLGKYPTIAVVDSGNNELVPDVHYIDANNLTVSFGANTSGHVYCN
jgi:hypothetical protein